MTRVRDRWMIPNLLSLLRLLCGVPLAVLFLQQRFGAALVVYLFIEFLDQADGKLARFFGWETLTGRFFDPFVDSFVHLTAFACLLTIDLVPLWMFLVFLFRESSLSFLRLLASVQSIRLGGSWAGKLKALTHVIAIVVCLWSLTGESASLKLSPSPWLYLAVFASIVTGIYYFTQYRMVLVKAFMVRDAP